jgi:hypothetical protein
VFSKTAVANTALARAGSLKIAEDGYVLDSGSPNV